jgi:hypothetical protein
MQGQTAWLHRAAVWLCLSAVACGPASYYPTVSREATRAVLEAREGGAARLAPYEYTAALLYLERAKELAGYARWQDALTLGRRATVLARAAGERARKAEAP